MQFRAFLWMNKHMWTDTTLRHTLPSYTVLVWVPHRDDAQNDCALCEVVTAFAVVVPVGDGMEVVENLVRDAVECEVR